MEQSHIKDLVLSVRELSSWPELAVFIERALDTSNAVPCWEYVTYSCRACGEEPPHVAAGSAAVFCLLQGIHLADDLLDEDPAGLHHELGVGAVANMALALQAAASRMIESHVAVPSIRVRIQGCLIQAALATSYGQYLDTGGLRADPREPPREEDYWRITDAKTPPLFEAASAIGALLADAPEETVEGCRRLGFLMGRLAQIGDDLRDIMERPARPDWQSRRNNLALVYALCSDYPEKERFLSAIERVEDPEELRVAQEILIRSGAASYCTYRMFESLREIRAQISSLGVPAPESFHKILEQHILPLDDLLQSLGAASAEELLQA